MPTDLFLRRGALLAAALGVALPSARAQDAAEAPAALAAPTFTLQTTPPSLAAPGFMSAVALVDLDGDGDFDAVEGLASGEVFSSLNAAGPTATPVYVRRAAGAAGLPASMSFAVIPAAGDIDGDGDVDLVFGVGDGTLRVALNTAGPGALAAFSAAATNPYGLADVGDNAAPALGDVDGDVDVDVLVGRTDGTVAFFENTAGPQATPAFALRTGAANPLASLDVGFSSAPHLVDLDGDGDLDVLVGNVDGVLALLTNTAGPRATPVFAAPVLSPAGLADVGYGSVPVAADLDADGDVDVLVGTSPGAVVVYRNDGTAGTLTARLEGTQAVGYRMLAAPSATATLAELFGSEIYTQGFPGATDPRAGATVYRYDETLAGDSNVGYVPPGNLSDAVGIGRGLFVQVFADEDPRPSAPGPQGGFPKTLRAPGRPALVPFTWGASGSAPLTYTDTPAAATEDGWNLLGNPFASSLDWDGTTLTNLNAAVYVYDDATAAYLTHTRGIPNAGSLPGGVVGPFQGFWVQASAATPALTARPDVSSGGPLNRDTEALATVIGLRLRPGADSPLPAGVASEAFLALGVEGAEDGLDALDARALTPPAPSYVLLATHPSAGAAPLAIDARPSLQRLDVELDVSAILDGGPIGGPLVLDWPGLDLSEGMRASLLDRDTDTVTDLRLSYRYSFTLAGTQTAAAQTESAGTPPLTSGPRLGRGALAGRFVLTVVPAGSVAAEPDAPRSATLSPPRPNPTSGGSRFRLELPEAARVAVGVYDALGRRVATLADAELGAGAHSVGLAPGRLAAGVYVVRADIGGVLTLTQRLTVLP